MGCVVELGLKTARDWRRMFWFLFGFSLRRRKDEIRRVFVFVLSSFLLFFNYFRCWHKKSA